MAECNNPECKAEFKAALHDLSENLYGDGPEGSGGVYGALKRKVGFKTLAIVLGMVLGAISFFAGLGINHESRISKTETTVDRNTGIIKELQASRHMEHQEILSAIRALKEK